MKYLNEKNIVLSRGLPVVFLTLIVLFSIGGCITTDGEGSRTDRAITPANEKADIYAQLAVSYMQKKQFSTAQAELEKALNIAPNHSQSNYIMGLLMIEIKEYDQVEKFISKAIDTDPRNSSAAHDLGTFLCQRGEELRSIKYFDMAAANPYFLRPELSLMRAGECLNMIGEPERAEVYLKESLKVNPQLKPSLLDLAKIKYEGGSYLSARAYIERFFAITKPQPESLLLGYQIESKLNAIHEANEYRTQLLEKFPSSDQARKLRNKS